MRAVLPVIRGLLAKDSVLPRLREVEPDGSEVLLTASSSGSDLSAELRDKLLPNTTRFTINNQTYTTEWIAHGGRAANKVALVTGAAQGFGFEIALDLAEQGAWVVVADINEPGAVRAAEQINEQCQRQAATGVALNVADIASLHAAVEKMVSTYGGIDLLVANAGVLRAGSVKELAVNDFDFVTSVNYKGYFLSVQAVAPVMALQHQAAPDIWSDIIQINSKSGLTGSNKNGAYAGSKFGGIGLTQSFALELVEDGIKVNSICPGNFYDGPLWSDPESGLFRQYLDSGKVPGAKTFEDVKHYYESKVPMQRGCTTPDVMKAVYYLMEQCYETGQALPVTGGQVMR